MERAKLAREDGSVLVMAAVCLIVAMGFAALTIDIGMATTAQAQLQNAADAAVLAGVAPLATNEYYTAYAEAMAFGNANTCLAAGSGLSSIVLGNYDHDTGQFQAWSEAQWGTMPTNAIKVTAARGQGEPAGPLPFAFAGILGGSDHRVAAESIAVADRRVVGFDGSVASLLLPFALSEAVAGCPPQIGRVVQLYPNLPDEEELVEAEIIVPGNFGLLDLNDSNAGTSVLSVWITDGYPLPVEIPEDGYLSVPGDPGLRNALKAAVEQRIGDTVVVLVYNGVAGQGSNTVYGCTSMVAVDILNVTGNGLDLSIGVRISQTSSSGFITKPGAPDNVSVARTSLAM